MGGGALFCFSGVQKLPVDLNYFYLARQNFSKGSECIAKSLIVDAFVQVLDENVSDT